MVDVSYLMLIMEHKEHALFDIGTRNRNHGSLLQATIGCQIFLPADSVRYLRVFKPSLSVLSGLRFSVHSRLFRFAFEPSVLSGFRFSVDSHLFCLPQSPPHCFMHGKELDLFFSSRDPFQAIPTPPSPRSGQMDARSLQSLVTGDGISGECSLLFSPSISSL